MNKPKVLIEISGGVVQCTYSDAPIELIICDWDNIRAAQSEDGLTLEGAMPVPASPDYNSDFMHLYFIPDETDPEKYRTSDQERKTFSDHLKSIGW